MEIAFGKLMDRDTSAQWVQLAAHVLRARATPDCCAANQQLEAAAEREPHAPVSPAYRLWVADNLARDGRFTEAALAYDAAVDRSQDLRDREATLDPTISALYHKAQALALGGSLHSAIQAFTGLEQFPSRAKDAFLQAGLLAERSGDSGRAADLYKRFAAQAPSPRTDDAAQLCRRALLRLKDEGTRYFVSQYELKDALTAALEHCNIAELERLLSRSHFAVGPVGGHTGFESPDLAEELARDLA
jgi:tetratricopeptide (TPR) repeat protein